MTASIRVTWLLVSISAALLVALLASPLASTAMAQNGEDDETPTEDQYEDECPGAQEVASIGPTTLDQREPFETSGDGFLVSYDLEFADPDDFNSFVVEVDGELSFESDLRFESGSYSFFVPEDPGSYEVRTDVSPNRGAEYTLTVQDCTGEDSQQPAPPADDPGDDDVASGVDPSTIPDKKLPNTGGPLVGLLLLGGGCVVAGSLLRATLGRSRE